MLYRKALETHRSTVEWLCSKHVTKTGNFCIHQPSRISTSHVLFSPVAMVSILKISSIEHLPPIHPWGGGRETNSFAREVKLVCNHYKVQSTNFLILRVNLPLGLPEIIRTWTPDA